MEDYTIEASLREMVDCLEELEKMSVQEELSIVQIYQFDKLAKGVIKRVEERCSASSAALQRRYKLYSSIALDGIDRPSELLFCNDQLAFFRNWTDSLLISLRGQQDRCQLDLTSRELLLIIRLLRESGVIRNPSIKSNLLFTQHFFYTDRQANFSYESLRKKYSELDRRTLLGVKVLLDDLLQRLKQYLL